MPVCFWRHDHCNCNQLSRFCQWRTWSVQRKQVTVWSFSVLCADVFLSVWVNKTGLWHLRLSPAVPASRWNICAELQILIRHPHVSAGMCLTACLVCAFVIWAAVATTECVACCCVCLYFLTIKTANQAVSQAGELIISSISFDVLCWGT